MKDNREKQKNETGGGTHAVSFRITESQHQDFLDLLSAVPGADAGAMYREIFRRGLSDLELFYEKHRMNAIEAAASEVES